MLELDRWIFFKCQSALQPTVIQCTQTTFWGENSTHTIDNGVHITMQLWRVRPSIDTSLSSQLLLHFSRDFDETFQLLFL